MLILAVLLAFAASVLPTLGHAQSSWTPINGTVTVINNSPGDQVDPHISGDLVTYTSVIGGNSYVHYYDFFTGTDAFISQGNSLDYLPDIDGSRIVYTSVTSNSFAIKLFDIGAGSDPVTLDPHPSDLRENPVVGNQTIAWTDFGLTEDPFISDMVVYDRITGELARLSDDQFYDNDASISPDGSLIVWTKCQTYTSGCHIWRASYNGSGWDVAPLTGRGEQLHPTTDGHFIVYDNYGDDTAQDSNIFWQSREDGVEYAITLPGNQRSPAIDRGVVVFESTNDTSRTSNRDILLYNLNTNVGYQVSTAPEREVMPDIAVSPDGLVRVVWVLDSATTNDDIYGSTFRLPATSNQPPVIDHISAPMDPMMVNSNVSVSADFSDPDVADTHTAVWDWGDGSNSSGMVDETGSTSIASGEHTYAIPGVYLLTLTVTDDQDASATATFQYVVVYDPVGGFVTGSGWIDSPAGAYALNPDLAGKAQFGFVSRYQKGASLPTGQTEFQFKAGDLSFRSMAYDWLIIAGPKAQFKGQGTVNESDGYGFLLTVTDDQVNGGGSVDKFRIKIWEQSSGEVVYDNQIGADETADPSTVIGGGSIVIHK